MALCFGVGAVSILQVIVEVTGLIVRRAGRAAQLTPASMADVAAGPAFIYSTALLV